ncbi:MAG: TlpA family protein disulfide reductase [Burkholderiales bacterium]|jgi:thiol-disulfide isomerase/thioredoxin|nr:TlpA family protein disulfide reductase [Burkholderiales bacterium]
MSRRIVLLLMLACAALGARAEVGDTVRWTDVPLYDGRSLPASALTGKTVVVEYWATWCPFCKKQNPYVQKLHERHGGKDLVVLTFSIDKGPADVADYMKKGGYTFPVAMAGEEAKRFFPKRKGLPVVYVVDPQGKVVFHEAGEMFEEDILGLARFATK